MGETKVILTEQALEDLEEIENYVSKSSVKMGRLLVSKFFDKFELIASFPEMGRIVPEFKNSYLREIFQSKYRIIYLVTDQNIEILRIIHGSKLIDTK
jgi:addiction module RelE/StbE family toxin